MNGLFSSPLDRPAQTFETILPEYEGGSIVNLMGSIIQGFGGQVHGYPPADRLDPQEIARHRHVVLIVVDGLGNAFLSGQGDDSCLYRNRRATLTSVFPSTTASAITSFLTGQAPQQHAITGWHMYFRELGAVLAVLPGRPRYGGVSLRQAGWNVPKLLGQASVFDRLNAQSRVVIPRFIARSDFNLAYSSRARLLPYDGIDDFFEAIRLQVTDRPERQFVYAYWPELDRIAHESGSHSLEVEDHFRTWDAAFVRLLEQLANTDTLIIVTADHGFIDTDQSHSIDLADYPDLAECLVLPLCGEPRAAYCYLRSGCARKFKSGVRRQLSHAAELHPSEALIRQGWFGLGAPHAQLASRTGDYTLIMKERYVIRDRLQQERTHLQRGVHGGISAEEMQVPLVVVST